MRQPVCLQTSSCVHVSARLYVIQPFCLRVNSSVYVSSSNGIVFDAYDEHGRPALRQPGHHAHSVLNTIAARSMLVIWAFILGARIFYKQNADHYIPKSLHMLSSSEMGAADLWAAAAAADPSWDGLSGEQKSRGISYKHIG